MLPLPGVLAAEGSCLISSLEFALDRWELSYSHPSLREVPSQ